MPPLLRIIRNYVNHRCLWPVISRKKLSSAVYDDVGDLPPARPPAHLVMVKARARARVVSNDNANEITRTSKRVGKSPKFISGTLCSDVRSRGPTPAKILYEISKSQISRISF